MKPAIESEGKMNGEIAFNIEEENGREIEMGSVKRSEIFLEVKRQLKLAGPLICVSFLQYSLQVISVMFVGHLGELPLSSASMATSFATVTGVSILTGMGGALDTLCGQSYGAKEYHMLGIHMQRAMVVLSVMGIPIALIWAYTGDILKAVGQDPDIAKGAGLFALYLIPMAFAYGLLQCLVRFLQTQNIVVPMMISSGISTLLHIPLCWLLVFKSGLAGNGAAVANSISYSMNVLLLALYVKFSPSCKNTWTGLSMEALHDIPNFLKLAIPSAFMVFLENWCFEIMVLLAGLLPNPKLETSVLSISLNTCSIAFYISYGLGSAASTRVSNELGAGSPKVARLSVCVALFMVVAEGILLVSILLSMRSIWGRLFSNEEEVIKYIMTMIPLIAVSNFLDGIQSVLSGVARGCGWQKMGAFINLGAYYFAGIPAAAIFAFVLHIGGKGLWLGLICGLLVQVTLLLTITLRTNWVEQAEQAKNRVYYSRVPQQT